MFEEKCLAYNQDYAKGKGSYSVNEICQILDICRDTAIKLIRSDVFESVRVGNHIRIVKSSFDAWLENNQLEVLKMASRQMLTLANERLRLNLNRKRGLL